MQKIPNLDKPLSLISFVGHRKFKAVQCSDELKPLRFGPFKVFNKHTEVSYVLLTQKRQTFHTH